MKHKVNYILFLGVGGSGGAGDLLGVGGQYGLGFTVGIGRAGSGTRGRWWGHGSSAPPAQGRTAGVG